MNILHIIYSLNIGGAEKTLIKLVVNDKKNNHIIVTLTTDNEFIKCLESNKIRVYNLDISFSLKRLIKCFKSLVNIIESERIDLIHTWMYNSDLIGSIISLITSKPIIWCIRNGKLNIKSSSVGSLIWRCTLIPISYFVPIRIISCSHSAKNIHTNIGYSRNQHIIIENGIDTNEFKPERIDNDNSNKMLENFNDNTILFALPARLDPQKNHKLIFKAIKYIKDQNLTNFDFKILLAGRGIEYPNLKSIFKSVFLDVEDFIYCCGEIKDMSYFYNSIKYLLLTSSYGEAFPNVLAEAMSCGIPCISTDVGDAKRIIGDTGWIVKSNNTIDLAEAIISSITICNSDYEIKSKKARERIVNYYSLQKMIASYQSSYDFIYNSIYK
mgnify:CR=1 FL=1